MPQKTPRNRKGTVVNARCLSEHDFFNRVPHRCCRNVGSSKLLRNWYHGVIKGEMQSCFKSKGNADPIPFALSLRRGPPLKSLTRCHWLTLPEVHWLISVIWGPMLWLSKLRWVLCAVGCVFHLPNLHHWQNLVNSTCFGESARTSTGNFWRRTKAAYASSQVGLFHLPF
jgi:hypothetical protein